MDFLTDKDLEKLGLTDDKIHRMKKYEIFKIGADAYLSGYDYERLKIALQCHNELVTDRDIMNILDASRNCLKTKNAISYLKVTGAIIKHTELPIFHKKTRVKKLTEFRVDGLYEKYNMRAKEISDFLSCSHLQVKTVFPDPFFKKGLHLYKKGITLEELKSLLILERELPSKTELYNILNYSKRRNFNKINESSKKISYLRILGAYAHLLNMSVDDLFIHFKHNKKYSIDKEIEKFPKSFY